MAKSDYRFTDRHQKKVLRAILEIEYEINSDFKFSPDLQVLEMTINPDYRGVKGLRVVSVRVVEPRPRVVDTLKYYR